MSAAPSIANAFKAPRTESQSSDIVVEAVEVLPTPVTTPQSAEEGSVKALQQIPLDFGKLKATDLLAVEVPHHILHRWKLSSPTCNVSELFGTNAKANVALRDIRIKMLQDLTGQTEFTKMPAKTGSKDPPFLGLTEIFSRRKIAGRCARCRSKGMMFFYLMCAYPKDVEFPEFTAEKRKRAAPYSLAESGRLVAILADPSNRSIVSMLFQKLKRLDVDALAGDKGPAFYWIKIAELYNSDKYVPPECDEFADHVASCGTTSVYSTALIPECRTADNLRSHWVDMRGNFGQFLQKYERSGHNEPDPTKYTTDLDNLLMHYTFKDTPDLAWASKSNMDGMDDAGDGNVRYKTGRKPKKSKVTFGADKLLVGASFYEVLCNASGQHMSKEQLEQHQVRMSAAEQIMDACLATLKSELGLE